MKTILRAFFIGLFSLFSGSKIISSFSYEGGIQTLLFGAVVLTFLNFFIRPILKILFLPLNVLTLGLFSLVLNAILLYLLTVILPEFIVKPYYFPGFTYSGFILPAIHFSLIATFVIISFVISLISSFLHWLMG